MEKIPEKQSRHIKHSYGDNLFSRPLFKNLIKSICDTAYALNSCLNKLT